ncbi:MAG TPA: ATP-binding protein [Bryobacteraceae bacterium]|nr:ATP-binding protein [Bryobacteraceae bacterium]
MKPEFDELATEHKFASLGRLVAGIVHEINTPIGSIFSNNEVILRSLEMLRKDLVSSTPQSLQHAREIVETCRSLAQVDKIACDRISAVVRGLKGFARTDGSEFRKVDLAEQIANTLKLVHGEFRRRIVFETLIGELPPIFCNPGKLNQVLLNLIVNAGQAIEGEGRIIIQVQREESYVHISIRDTGKGIPPEVRDRIFHSGFTTKAAGEGTGLGLTISKQIIEQIHHGSLDFESEPGEGTTFHIRIPTGAPLGQQ